ncbi:MAG: hydrogenase [Rubrivivax sp.]|nr:hydrogenase [Rubrivivax sp.]
MTEPSPSDHPARAARPDRPARHPLIDRLLAVTGGREVRADDVDAFEQEEGGDAVLFFGGDPVRFPEALDVAVVLPELLAALGARARVGVVPRDAEDAVARRYAVQRWPSIVFLRDSGYLGSVSGMQDWDVYLREAADVLARAPGRRPAPAIAIQAAPACH